MLNITRVQRLKQAMSDHRLKRIFELSLIKKIQPIFRGYSKDFHATVLQNGGFASTDILQQNMKDTLSKHYDAVLDKFGERIVKQTTEPENYGLILDSIVSSGSIHNELRANESSMVIAETTRKDAIFAIHNVQQEALAKGEAISNKTLANRARLKLNQKIAGRINTISISETQNPAENAKQTEIDFLAHHDADIDGVKMSQTLKQKQWIAILDNVTRIAHAEADGQIVDYDQPYEVDGQQLMYPGDMNLGATIDNVINCRCDSIIMISVISEPESDIESE